MIRMPWTDATAPNAMIEIVDGCNVRCGVCFHRTAPAIKTLDEIREDLRTASRLRRLHTVTISGGEPTLHPQLCEVVRLIKEQGFHAFLLTNGLLVDRACLCRLRQAGLDSILFHVDQGQCRPDLPANPGFPDVSKRLNELVSAAASEGLDVSASFTLYRWEQIADIASYFMDHPDITFLFLSKAVDCPGFFAHPCPAADGPELDEWATPGVRRVIEFFREHHALDPFSYIPALGGRTTVWISYFVPAIYHPGGYATYPYRSTWIDGATMRLARLLTGRYIHKTTQNPALTWARMWLNAAARFRPMQVTRFWLDSRHRGYGLRHKMIVYDDGPFWTREGSLQHCSYCPTAVVRNGALIPCCTSMDASETLSP